MKKLKQPLTSFTKVIFALITFISRLGFLPANLSPVGSLGFFNKSLWPLILVTLGFDLWHGGFYSGFGWTYLGFFGYWLMGQLVRGSQKEKSRVGKLFAKIGLKSLAAKQLAFLPLASFLFFAFSNFGVWLGWYPHTLEGFITCYTLAIPFYRNTLLGDLVFGWGWLVLTSLLKSHHFNFRAHFSK